MPAQYNMVLSEPKEWLAFHDKRAFYADPHIISADSICSGMRIYQARTVLDGLKVNGHSVRPPTDRECNIMASENPTIAEQMREYFIFTGVLRDVGPDRKPFTCVLRKVRTGQWGKHKASYIESPKFTDDGHMAEDKTAKKIIIPHQGWFGTEELLRSGTGLPRITYKKPPDGPCAYLMVQNGQKMALLRGHNYRAVGNSMVDNEDTAFAVTIRYEPTAKISHLGILAVSDHDPNPKKAQKP